MLNGQALHPDFWNIQSGTGRVRSVGVEPLVPAGFRAKHVSEARVGEKWEAVLDEVSGFRPQVSENFEAHVRLRH